MKVITVLGARPQFIKAASVSRSIKKYKDIEEIIIHTGQHFDGKMSDIFFKELEIPNPKYNLGINSLSHGAMTGRMLEELEKIFLQEKPDMVIVYGDTNSTLAGALAAKKIHIPVAHIEAGLRSFNMKMPEEINRILVDQISDLLFCPTTTALKHLQNEGFAKKKDVSLIVCGDVMYDSALFASKDLKDIAQEPYALVTIHREDNTTGENLDKVLETLNALAQKIKIIFPVHPRTKSQMRSSKIVLDKNVNLIDPVSYFEMIKLLKGSQIVVTDSGGLQKEAYFLKKPCITLRDETEWTELTNAGVNILCGIDKDKTLSAFDHFVNTQKDFSSNFYGQGNSSDLIAEKIHQNLSTSKS